ncbi:kinesin-like protein KIF6 [Colletes gigas]|uniref:kinesin-like protein KIF6 n=1 Tax=Colletes gigas TaxID=935657 RepID=UPI001C9A486E|nr:kinesin-like protein KIF6 [Colletes gigas]
MVKNAIKVYARLMPEKNRRDAMDYKVYHRPKENVEEDVLLVLAPTQKSKDYPDNRAESWNFSFFRIFEEPATQGDVFDNVARPVVESALDGYNGTIFAYGQTASGKTYSIIGNQRNHEDRGIVPRSLQYLFDVIQKRPENVYSVEVAFMEIYNENGYDLLDRRQREFAVTRLEDLPRVTIQEDENGKLHLKNLTFHNVGSLEDAFELLLMGDHYRVTTETPMNPHSSRSHCIFTIVVSKKEFGADHYTRAKVHLVDLAGSERVYKSSISGTTLTEAKYINLSLHYLEQVIVCLGQESVGHIPYRNSCLTSILRDSLGGNCMTTMLATVSVVCANLEETVSTCKFAQRVALIRNDVKLVVETSMQSENALLRLENERLRQEIRAMAGQMNSQELTADDKRTLDSRIRAFLESDAKICWDYNPKRVEYCFESFKRTFELSRDPKSCLKKLEYYKDMVVQRDKEISLLIDLLKKEKEKRQHGRKQGCSGSVVNVENSLTPNVQTNESGEPSALLSIEAMENRNQLDASVSMINENIMEDNTVPTVANILDETKISTLNRVRPKKSKRKSKHSKTMVQNHVEHNQNKSNCDEIDTNNSFQQFSTNRSSELLPYNVVNLNLCDLIENKVTEKEENQQSFRKPEGKQSKCGEIQTSTKKNRIRQKIQTNVKINAENDNNLSIRTKIPIEETDDTFYQRFLSFNVPDNPTRSSSKELFRNERFKTDFEVQDHGSSINNSSRLNLESKNFDTREQQNDKMYNDIRDNSSFRELESNRIKKIGRRTSVDGLECSEKSCIISGGIDVMKEGSDRKNYDRKNEHFEKSLPLTGDPEIDEEIIAFYKAKRSGGIY